MKLRSFLLLISVVLAGNVFATNVIKHSETSNTGSIKALNGGSNSDIRCRNITIINDLYYPIRITGQFADGEYFGPYLMPPFDPYNPEASTLDIILSFNFQCHSYVPNIRMNYINTCIVYGGKYLYTSDFLPMQAQSK
jgi:hypothetical protein